MSSAKFYFSKGTLVALLPLFLWLMGSAHAGQTLPTIPPERAFKWDISRKNSVVKQDFEVRECRSYLLAIGFAGPDAAYDDGRVRKDADQSWRNLLRTMPNGPFDGPLSTFIGGGSQAYYLKDGTDPYPVKAGTPEEVLRLQELFRQGKLIQKFGNPGVVVPVRVVVEKIDASGISSVVTDQTIETGGVFSGGYLIARQIAWVVDMKRGIHRVTATTLRDSPLPEGVGTYLTISRMKNSSASKECN